MVAGVSVPVNQQANAANFDLDFQRDETVNGVSRLSNDSYIVCDMPGLSDVNCGGGGMMGGGTDLSKAHIDGSTFLQETLVDVDGTRYWHIIVGDYAADGFAQEVFIKSTTGTPDCFSGGGMMGGGNIPCSDSLADTSSQSTVTRNMGQPYQAGVNAGLTGTGTANPNSTIFRQLMSDGEITYEFIKDQFDKKQKLTQNISAPGIAVNFMVDMSTLTFNDNTPINSATQMINSVELTGTDAPANSDTVFQQAGAGNFDMGIGTGIQTSRELATVNANVTAGGYIYTPGTGPGGSGGYYSFEDGSGGFDPTTEWSAAFCDPSQNPIWGDGACLGDSR